MTDLSPDEIKQLTPVDLSDVSPTNITSTSLLQGTITIKWPYSSSTQSLTFLLANPDPRKRASGGQLKITLLGPVAEFLDKIHSGEQISIAPNPYSFSVNIEKEESSPRVKWHITFPKGCIIIGQDGSARLFIAPKPGLSQLARVSASPGSIDASPPSQKGLWKTPLKRKFQELTDHSIASALTDEEEWFGTEPKGSPGERRRFSGRVRFIGLDDVPATPTPNKRVSDENSFVGRSPVTTTGVSPAPVLRAQNLVFAEIMSEKLLHPPRGAGTGVDDISHAAVQEGSMRPLGTEVASTSGNRSFAERSFEVFKDQERKDGLETTDILPKELTKPTQAERLDIPDGRDERRSPVRQFEEPELEEIEVSPGIPQHAQAQTRIMESVPSTSPDQYEGQPQAEPDRDARKQPVRFPGRRYYPPESREPSSDRFIEFNRADHEYLDNNAEYEELSPEEYEEEDDLHHAGYYSQSQRGGLDEEYYHSDEVFEEQAEYEEEETEEESSGEEESVRNHAPVFVDLTLDSDEEVEIPVAWSSDQHHKHSEDAETEESDEKEITEEPEEGRDEKIEEESWTGIKSRTSLVNPSQLSQNQSPQIDQPLEFLLDPNLLTQFPNTVDQSAHFNFDSKMAEQSQNITQSDVAFPPELLAQSLIPTVLQQSTFQPLPSEFIEPPTASFLDSVLSFPTDPTAMSSNLSMEPPAQGSTVLSTLEVDAYVMSEVQPNTQESFDKGLQRDDTQEFLTGLIPITGYDSQDAKLHEQQQEVTQEFLPGIVPSISAESYTLEVLVDTGERKVRSEVDLDMEVTVTSIEVAQPPDTTDVDKETQNGDVSIERSSKTEPESQKEPSPFTSGSPTVQFLRSGTPPPIPDAWRVNGLTTDLGYYPPLVDIVPPSLRAQKENRVVDIIGVIRGSGDLGKSKGPDYVLPLHLVDPSTGTNNGLSTLLFRPYKSALPVNPVIGSVIMLTNMKVQSHNHRGQVATTESSGWILFPPNGCVQESGPPAEYGKAELLMVKQLQWWWKRNLEKGKGREIIGKDTNPKGIEISGHKKGNSALKGIKAKNKARRGGKVVNLNR